jgi:hypothetical protein
MPPHTHNHAHTTHDHLAHLSILHVPIVAPLLLIEIEWLGTGSAVTPIDASIQGVLCVVYSSVHPSDPGEHGLCRVTDILITPSGLVLARTPIRRLLFSSLFSWDSQFDPPQTLCDDRLLLPLILPEHGTYSYEMSRPDMGPSCGLGAPPPQRITENEGHPMDFGFLLPSACDVPCC